MLTPLRGQTSAKLAVRNPSSNGAPELAGEHFSPVSFLGGMGLTCLEKSNIKMFCTYSSASGDSTCFFSFVFLVKEHAFKLYIYMADVKDFSCNILLSDASTFGVPCIIDRLRPLIWVTAWCEMDFVGTSARHPR